MSKQLSNDEQLEKQRDAQAEKYRETMDLFMGWIIEQPMLSDAVRILRESLTMKHYHPDIEAFMKRWEKVIARLG